MSVLNIVSEMYVTLRINDKCDFACRYCFTHLSNETGCEMSKETADDVLDYCLDNQIKRVDIPQKEPLLSFDILKYMIETYNANGVKVSGITTNLYNLTDEVIDVLKKHRLFVLVSYDGLWHDEYRVLADGSPTEERVRDNIYRLRQAGINFNIACAIVHGTADRIYKNYKYLMSVHKSIVFNFDVSSPFAIQTSDLPAIESGFTKIANETPGLNIFPLNKIAKRVKQSAHYTNHMCGAGRGSYTIDWDGQIYPCYHVPAWQKMGISLGNIYDGLDMQEKEKFRHYDTALPEKCRNCNVALCGTCYTASYDALGKMTMPIDINCKIFNLLTQIVRKKMN